MNIANRLACVAVAALLPTAASAQSVNFWLAALPGNIQGCIAADPQFTREHTFTVKDGEAEITSPGGINTKLKLVAAQRLRDGLRARHGCMCISSPTLPRRRKTLNVTEKNLGCKWTAKKE